MKCSLFLISTLFMVLYAQVDYGYNPKLISPKVRSIIENLENAKRVESSFIYESGKRSKIHEQFAKLNETASVNEFIELTNHFNAVVRYYAYAGLLSKTSNVDTLYNIVLKHLTDTIPVETLNGCIGSLSSMSDYVISSFKFNENVHPGISQLVTIDSLLEANQIRYEFYPLTPDSIRNQVRKQIEPDLSTWNYYPLVRYTDKYPLEMKVEGKIVDLTVGIPCGIFCGCGTIKVLLDSPVKGYEPTEVFIAIPCHFVQADWLNKRITIHVKALLPENKECYWDGIRMNFIDSKGLPFYIPGDADEAWKLE